MADVTEQQVKLALRILVDFLKSEAEETGLTYEPLLSYLLAHKQKFLL